MQVEKSYEHNGYTEQCFAWRKKVEAFNLNAILTLMDGGGSIILCRCFDGKWAGEQQKWCIMRKEDYPEILKQNTCQDGQKIQTWSQLGPLAGQWF